MKEDSEKYELAIKDKPDDYEAFHNWGNALSDLAATNEDEALFNEAFEKYGLATKHKPDYHEVFYNWGSALFDLWALTGDDETFKSAVAKIDKAIDINPLPICFANKARMLLWYGHNKLLNREEESLKCFKDSLEVSKSAEDEMYVPELVGFFEKIISSRNAEGSLILLTHAADAKESYGMNLLPFAFACKYWVGGNDEEVLKDLEPDLLKLVRAVIAQD